MLFPGQVPNESIRVKDGERSSIHPASMHPKAFFPLLVMDGLNAVAGITVQGHAAELPGDSSSRKDDRLSALPVAANLDCLDYPCFSGWVEIEVILIFQDHC